MRCECGKTWDTHGRYSSCPFCAADIARSSPVKTGGASCFSGRPTPEPRGAGRKEALIADLLNALEKAAVWFDEYAFQHGCKATQTADRGEQASRLDKAKRNRERADELRAVIGKAVQS
jgi:hypothetical protein